MADMASITAGASHAANTASMVLFWVFLFIFIAMIIGFMIYILSFNCKVRIKYLTNSQDQFSDKKGKVVRDRKDGIEKLVIKMGLFRKVTMPSPPPEATSLDLKGRRCFEIEFGDDGSKRYIVRDKAKNQYQPLNTNDRVFYLNEEEKRMQRYKKSLSELIAQMIPYLVLVIILGMLLGFWGDVVKPLREENAEWRAYTNDITAKQAQIMADLREIIKREQVVPSEPAPVRPVENLPPVEIASIETPPTGD